MTVTTETNRWTFNGNGVTLAFAYTNRIFADTDLEVFLSGVLQTLTTDYTVSGVNVPTGGNVTFVVAPPVGTKNVVVVRDVPARQPTDYTEGGKFPAESHETALDRATVVSQQIQADILRSLRLADSDPDFSIDAIPDKATRANARLGFDASSAPIAVTADITGVAATAFGASLMDDVDATEARATLGVVIGTDVQADLDVPSLAEAQAGAATTERVWTAERVKQAIAALAPSPIPSGTVMLFHQETVPTGWTRVTTAAIDKHAMVVDTLTALGSFTGSKGGANNFATALNGTIASGTHAGTTPSHTHTIDTVSASTVGASAVVMEASDPADGTATTSAGGAGGTHTHVIDVQIAYINLFLASKN